MPDIAQMFPSPYLQPTDLPHGKNTVVTIESVYPFQATKRPAFGEPDIKWMIKFREYRKPLGLWKATAKVIADVLGTTVTEQWEGQKISIYAGSYSSFGEIKPCINVDVMKPRQDPPKSGSMILRGDSSPIPKDRMDRFLGMLKVAGVTWDDFLKWSKSNAPGVLELAWGVDLDAVPSSILPAMATYLKLCPQGQPEAIDTQTGEVMQVNMRPSVPSNAIPPSQPQPAQPNDDIPF